MVRVGVLKVEIVLLFVGFVEFGRSNIETNLDLAFVPCLLDRLNEDVQGFFRARDIRRKTALVTDIGS